MTPEEILESIRELAYDLERAQNDREFSDLLSNYVRSYPESNQIDWNRALDRQFKPAIRAEELICQWTNKRKIK